MEKEDDDDISLNGFYLDSTGSLNKRIRYDILNNTLINNNINNNEVTSSINTTSSNSTSTSSSTIVSPNNNINNNINNNNNHNNNNNNNQQKVNNKIIPIYLQKNILNILCTYINKNLTTRNYKYNKSNKKEIKKLVLALATVSWDWFNILSENLYVSINFNYKSPKDAIALKDIVISLINGNGNNDSNGSNNHSSHHSSNHNSNHSSNQIQNYNGSSNNSYSNNSDSEEIIPTRILDSNIATKTSTILATTTTATIPMTNINHHNNNHQHIYSEIEENFLDNSDNSYHSLEINNNNSQDISFDDIRNNRELNNINNNHNNHNNISNNNNINNSKYLILKPNNIKILKITKNNLNPIILKNIINKEIKELLNLEKITVVDYNDQLEFINFQNIKVQTINAINITNLSLNIKQIATINNLTHYTPDRIIDLFQRCKVKIFCLEMYPYSFPFKELYDSGSLVSIIQCEYYDYSLTVRDLYYILMGSKKVKQLSFDICFDNLIYCLTEKKTSCCPQCSSNESFDQFNQYWSSINDIIVNHQYLSFLSIKHRCGADSNNVQRETDAIFHQESRFPDEFIEKFGGMLAKNKSIEKVIFYSMHTPQLFEYIINNGNTNITRFTTTFINTHKNKQQYVESIEKLLPSHPHIESFTVRKTNDSYDEDDTTILCYLKGENIINSINKRINNSNNSLNGNNNLIIANHI